KNDTTKRHAAAGSDACRWYFGDSKCPATAAWWWRTTRGSTCRTPGRTAFRTGAAHGSAADVRAANVGAPHVSAANPAQHGATEHAASHGEPARQCTTYNASHGNATHSAAFGQSHCPAAAIPSGACITSTGAAVGAGTFPDTF